MLIQDILRPEQIVQLREFKIVGPPTIKHKPRQLKRIKVQ